MRYATENNCIAPTCSYSTSGEGGAMTSSSVAYSPGGVDDRVSWPADFGTGGVRCPQPFWTGGTSSSCCGGLLLNLVELWDFWPISIAFRPFSICRTHFVFLSTWSSRSRTDWCSSGERTAVIGCSFSEIERREDFHFASSLLSDCVCCIYVCSVQCACSCSKKKMASSVQNMYAWHLYEKSHSISSCCCTR